LRNSGLVFFEVTANYLLSKYRLRALIFKIPASAKLAVKYRPSWWNAEHLATLPNSQFHHFKSSDFKNASNLCVPSPSWEKNIASFWKI